MKTKILPFFIFFYSFLFAQMQPADSLTGTYAGDFYFKQPISNPWTITPDTFYVQNIDSVTCSVLATNGPLSYGGNYYTDYFSCNGAPPSNYYMKFYSGDSLKWISDSVLQPPPNPPLSRRFYGKRISSLTSIDEYSKNIKMSIYPIPCGGKFIVEGKGDFCVYNLLGEIVYRNFLHEAQTEIDLSEKPAGIYFIQLKAEKGIANNKLIIQK